MTVSRPLNKKQILEAIAKKEPLIDCDMRGLDLSGVCFDGMDLRRCKLGESNLSRATFRGADLYLASMWHSELQDAVFDEANLEEADLDFANLDGCTFKGAKVRKAIFPFSRLSLEKILDSVKTGKKVHMIAQAYED